MMQCSKNNIWGRGLSNSRSWNLRTRGNSHFVDVQFLNCTDSHFAMNIYTV